MSKEPIPLGKLIDTPQHRDAIHIAIAPVVAAERLSPGQDVGFAGDDYRRVSASGKHVGIIDPFLKHAVLEGDSCWLLLYPNTITSLRHEWTHPEIPAEPQADVKTAKAWLKSFADTAGITYDELLEAAEDWLERGDYLIQGGRWEGFHTPDEFWPYYETATGRTVREEDRGSFFSCSC